MASRTASCTRDAWAKTPSTRADPGSSWLGSPGPGVMDAAAGDVVVEVGGVHLHHARGHAVLLDVHRVAVGHGREVLHRLVLAHPLADRAADVFHPFLDERALLGEIALVADGPVTGHEGVLAQAAQRLERGQPAQGVALLDPRLTLAEDVVAGEDDTLLLHDHGGLVGRVPGHADETERVVADVQGHL